LRSLETLMLANARVTDKGPLHLTSLTKLKYLDVRADFESTTKITRAGAEVLRHAIPGLTIRYYDASQEAEIGADAQ